MSRGRRILSLAATLLLASDALVGCSSNSSGPPGPGVAEDGGDGGQGSSTDGSLDGGTDARSVDATLEDASDGEAADAGGQAIDSGDAETSLDAWSEADGSGAATADSGSVDAGASDGSTDAESQGFSDASDAAPDALVEAGVDAGDAGDGGEPVEAGISQTLNTILQTQGSQCAACAAQYCLGAGQTCESLGSAVAAAGPSAGTLRSTLCFQTLSCLVNPTPTGLDGGVNAPCYELGPIPEACYCGDNTIDTPSHCMTDGPDPDAQCGTVELAGFETTNPGTAFTLFNESTTTLGSQMANQIVECMTSLNNPCANYCLL